MRYYLTNKPEHNIEVRHSDLLLAQEALATQIRLLDARVNKTRDDDIRLIRFNCLKEKIDDLILKD